LSDPAVTVVVVEYGDRFTRFGFEHLVASMTGGRRVVVVDDAGTSDDVVADVTEVLTSLCVCLYGCRSLSRGAAEAVVVATGGGPG
jgi:putative resolvase